MDGKTVMRASVSLKTFNEIAAVGDNNGSVTVLDEKFGEVDRSGFDPADIQLWQYLKDSQITTPFSGPPGSLRIHQAFVF